MKAAGPRRIRAGTLVGRLLRQVVATFKALPARMLAHGAQNIATQFHRLDQDEEREDDGNW